MALVMNASSQEQQVRVHGAWFTFKPKQMKEMHEDKVYHLTSTCAYMGFVALPESMSDLDFKNSKEGQALIKEAEAKGVQARIDYLESLKRNEIVHLQRDISKQNLNYDARLEMDPAMIKNLEELATYKASDKKAGTDKLEKIKALEAVLEE